MTRVYDNWERLVKATLDREELRYLAFVPSMSTSFSSSTSTSSKSVVGALESDIFEHVIQLAYKVIREAEAATAFKQEFLMLKTKVQKLAGLLRLVVVESNDLYSPTHRIISDTVVVLEKALALVLKCRPPGLKRVFFIIPAVAFRRMSIGLENSICNVSWLVRICAYADEYLGLPEIASKEPILCLIWEQIAALYKGSVDDQADAAATLVILARDSHQCRKLIIKEGGVGPLLKLVKEGKLEGQENAAMAIGWLGKDEESVEHMIHAGVCSVFVEILKEVPMKVQAVVAWAVSELVVHYPKCQHLFAQHNIIQLLVSHLAFDKVEEHSKTASAHAAVVLANSDNSNAGANDGVMQGSDFEDDKSRIPMLSGASGRATETEESEIDAYRKEMAASALWKLAKGNSTICQSIIELRALSSFAVLLEKGPPEVQFTSVMALMEITAVAEEDAELRELVFKPDISPGFKAVVDQLVRVIEKSDSELLVPCVQVIGNLARTLTTTEIITPLVKLLDDTEAEVSREACIALTKFACSECYLHLDHSKAIIDAGGVKLLVQLVYLGEPIVQSCALILLCYIAMHVPHSEELTQAEVLITLRWSSKQDYFVRVKDVKKLLAQAERNLELYQSSGSSGDY